VAEINLLKQNVPKSGYGNNLPSLLVKFLVVLGVGLVGYWGFLYFNSRKVANEVESTQTALEAAKAQAVNFKDRNEILTRQAQLKTLDSLITGHPYWSHLLPALAKVTLKTSSYSAIRANGDGNIILSVRVPSLQDLDKYLQVFDLQQFNQNFSDVRIGAFHEEPNGQTTNIRFDVKMKYNTTVLNYNSK